MRKDLSRLFFNKYLRLTDKTVRVVMSDGKIIDGVIVGFFKGDRCNGDTFISKWHVVNIGQEPTLGIDMAGGRIGFVILQQDISQIYFFENGFRMCF